MARGSDCGMKAGDYFLVTMSVGYLCAAVAYWVGGDKGMGAALAFYACANIGLIASSHGI